MDDGACQGWAEREPGWRVPCKQKENCYRYTSPKDEHSQFYIIPTLEIGEDMIFYCPYYIEEN